MFVTQVRLMNVNSHLICMCYADIQVFKRPIIGHPSEVFEKTSSASADPGISDE